MEHQFHPSDRLYEWLSEVENTGGLMPPDLSLIRELIHGYERHRMLVTEMESCHWSENVGFGWGVSRKLRIAAGLEPEPTWDGWEGGAKGQLPPLPDSAYAPNAKPIRCPRSSPRVEFSMPLEDALRLREGMFSEPGQDFPVDEVDAFLDLLNEALATVGR